MFSLPARPGRDHGRRPQPTGSRIPILVGIVTVVLGTLPVPLLLETASAAARPPLISGHRGATGVSAAAESTPAAFRYAAAAGAAAVEFDVRWTRDQRMVVLHDHTLDRTTNCTGPVENVTFAQLRRCAPAAVVPRFGTVLRLAAEAGMQVNPELKPVPGHPLTTKQAHEYVERINDYRMATRVVVSSTSTAILNKVKAQRAAKGFRYSLITGRTAAVTPTVARAAGSVYMPDYRTLTRVSVARYHRAGVKLWAWPARNAADYAAMTALGVDVIVADDPAAAAAWIRARR